VPFAIRLQIVCLLAAASAHSAERWIKLSSPHFLMYTTNGRQKAVDALRTFEEAHDFFAATSSSKPDSADCVEIIAFSSEKQFSPYRINPGAFAYYQRGHKCDYIVMQQLGREAMPGRHPRIHASVRRASRFAAAALAQRRTRRGLLVIAAKGRSINGGNAPAWALGRLARARSS
jgi:hypothetical protein